jgi:pyruvate formate lyase activating enzyme
MWCVSEFQNMTSLTPLPLWGTINCGKNHLLEQTVLAMRATKLADILDQLTVEGELYEKLDDHKVRCYACGHRCVIFDGQRGICKVRCNRGGKLFVPHDYTTGLQSDPVEKKPFFHVLPGADALTFGMLGCDFHCSYCQNWISSQALRDDAAGVAPQVVSDEDVINTARRLGSQLVVSSYNEPLITAEWAGSIFEVAKEEGLITGFVSNGNATPEVLDYLRPVTDCYKVDLKSMRQENYRTLGGQLKHVLWTIEELHRRRFWVEIVTLVVPGFNDSNQELREAARFIAGVSHDIPWHVTAFHKDYKMHDPDNTPVEMLIRAAEIGVEAGLNFVYAGNIPGQVGRWENTYCSQCQQLLIARTGYWIDSYHLTPEGRCPQCQTAVPGIFWPSEEARRQGSSVFARRVARLF